MKYTNTSVKFVSTTTTFTFSSFDKKSKNRNETPCSNNKYSNVPKKLDVQIHTLQITTSIKQNLHDLSPVSAQRYHIQIATLAADPFKAD